MLTSSSVRLPTGFLSPSSHSTASSSLSSFALRRPLKASYTKSNPSCCRCSSLRFQERRSSESTSTSSDSARIEDALGNRDTNTMPAQPRTSEDGEEEEEVSGIQVPRQKYIPISKSQLLDAIVLVLLEDDGGGGGCVEEFLRLSSCLDSILHAEHKMLLEDMRVDYALTHCGDQQGSGDEVSDGEGEVRMGLDYGLDELRKLLLGYSGKKLEADSGVDSRLLI